MVDTLIRESPSGPLIAVGGGETGLTLTTVRYVDPATELDPDNQTGSDEAPFATLQQALDSIALAELTNATIFLIDGDYGSLGASYGPLEDDVLQIVGFGSAQNIGAFTIVGGSGSSRLTFRNLSVSPNVFSFTSNTTGGTYEFEDMVISGVIDALNSTVNLTRATAELIVQTTFLNAQDSFIDGNVVSEGPTVAQHTNFQGDLTAAFATLDSCTVAAQLGVSTVEAVNTIRGCRIGNFEASGACFVYDTIVTGSSSFLGLIAYATTFTALDIASDAELHDCTVTGDIVCVGPLTAYSTTFSGAATFVNQSIGGTSRFVGCVATLTNDLAGDTIVMSGCIWPGSITTTTALQLLDTYMYVDSGPAPLSCAAGQIEIFGSRLAGDVTASALIIDTVSWQAAISGGVTFTTTTRQVTDLPLSATISIVVPAVAAGAVGYVTTSLVGSPLEGIFAAANDPVTVNPQTDLVAAGAGGGFINARINAADSLRSSFVGPLAGGAANFTVTRAR